VCGGAAPVIGTKIGPLAPEPFEIRSCSVCGYSFVANPWCEYERIYDERYYRGQGADPLVDYVYELEHPDRTVRQWEWRGLLDMVGSLAELTAATRWLDFGCGNGGLVRYARQHTPAQVFGYENGWIKERAAALGIPFLSEAQLAEQAGSFDMVTAIEVIEHVPDPLGFLSAIRTGIGAGPARLFIETPCVEWILANNMFQDFFFEHCSLFTVNSLAIALEKCGFAVDSITHVFGGQYLWAEAHTKTGGRSAVLGGVMTARWRERLAAMKAEIAPGKLAVWGAGAKGVTFALQCDPNGEFLDCVIDINPAKQGHYLPVSAYSIVSPDQARARGVKGAIVMNEIYFDEIIAQTADLALFSFEREHAALTRITASSAGV
jgi:cyclopropane fatty-acyl-phospholipid synthase-like methyltransferase